MVSIADIFLVWWLRRGRYGWSWLHRRLFERKYLVAALPSVNSLEDIASRLKEVQWTMDGPLYMFDCISYPQATWMKKRDDCDGFAILAAHLLQQWRPDTTPVLITAMLHPVSNSHTVCGFYSQDGSLWYFDNSLMRQGNFSSYADIVSEIKGTNRLVCWDVREPVRLGLIEFHKT